MNSRLYNKIIVVTGGNGLLGASFIKTLKSNGAIVVNLDINHETNESLTKIKCDITNEYSVDESIEKIIKKFNRIDGLVNNAYPRTEDWGNKLEDVKLSSWKKNIDIQLNSYFYISQKVSLIMKNERSGSIVNIGSIYGSVGPDFSVYEGTNMTMPVGYSAIKGAIINLTRYLAAYLGPYNVRVNTISPGGIKDNQNELFVSNYENKTPLRRMGTPEDISPMLAFLLSDESSYITGQNIIIDGGWTSI